MNFGLTYSMLPALSVMMMETGLCSTASDNLRTSSSACLRCQITNAITHNTLPPIKRLNIAKWGLIPGGERKNPASMSNESTAASQMGKSRPLT